MIARPLPPPPQTDATPAEASAALLALCAHGKPPDDELRALLLELRRARVAEVRAIESYLGLAPARSERGRGVNK